MAQRPIGIFDSGVGGLTVYRALRVALPHEDFIYFGDTAHLPYGAKTKEEVEAYTVNAAVLLRERGIKFLTIACNTVSAQALNAVQAALPDLPFCGVIATGAEAAIKATRNGHIAVLATDGTVRSGIYPEVLRGLRPEVEVQMLGCPQLVLLAEQGIWQGPGAEAAVSDCLARLTPGYDTLVLGCTHFPLLLSVLRKLVAPTVQIIDGAVATAQAVAGILSARRLANTQMEVGRDQFLVSANHEKFAAVAAHFLGHPIEDLVVCVDAAPVSLQKQ